MKNEETSEKNRKRIVCYMTNELGLYVKQEAFKMGMTESTFIRFLILSYKKKQ